jgi:hypothetical protein
VYRNYNFDVVANAEFWVWVLLLPFVDLIISVALFWADAALFVWLSDHN